MQLKGEENKSPMEMFLIGMVEREAPGVQDWIHQQEVVDDLPNYGLAWEDLGERMAREVVEEGQIEMPFQVDNQPEELHEIGCKPPGCPLTAGEKERLDAEVVCDFGANRFRSMPEHRSNCAAQWYSNTKVIGYPSTNIDAG